MIENMRHTVDRRNPAPVQIGSLSVYPIIYRVLYIPGGDRRISSIDSSFGFPWLPRVEGCAWHQFLSIGC